MRALDTGFRTVHHHGISHQTAKKSKPPNVDSQTAVMYWLILGEITRPTWGFDQDKRPFAHENPEIQEEIKERSTRNWGEITNRDVTEIDPGDGSMPQQHHVRNPQHEICSTLGPLRNISVWGLTSCAKIQFQGKNNAQSWT